MMTQAPERILVTGAGGFVGRRLVGALSKRFPNARIVHTDRSGGAADVGELRVLDVTDGVAVAALIEEIKPQALIHLAAVTAVADSFQSPKATWQINVLGTLEVILALQHHAPDCHLLYVSSAEVYGRSAFNGDPVNEGTLLQPVNPYAATKAAADLMVQEASGRGLFATIVRPFNHTGAGQDDRFVIPAFCSQVARIERGLQAPEMFVGELNDERDFLDVDDVVDLYVRVVERGRSLPSGLIVNASSGVARRIGDILNSILSASTTKISVSVDPSRLRPTRVPRIVGDASRAQTMLGWTPKKPFEATLVEALDYWRGRV